MSITASTTMTARIASATIRRRQKVRRVGRRLGRRLGGVDGDFAMGSGAVGGRVRTGSHGRRPPDREPVSGRGAGGPAPKPSCSVWSGGVSDNPVLSATTDGRVRCLELSRPDKRNALSQALRTEIAEALAAAGEDEAVGAVLLTGAGSAFCAGFDLAELAASSDPGAVFAEARHYHRAVHGFAKPIVAAVNGPALAGGFDLALLCDVRIASSRATFGQPQVRLGVPASYDLVAHVLGVAVARDLCLSGRVLDADEALRLHVVSQVTEPADLQPTAIAYAHGLADSPGAAAGKRQVVARLPDLW